MFNGILVSHKKFRAQAQNLISKRTYSPHHGLGLRLCQYSNKHRLTCQYFRYMYGFLKQKMRATEANVHMALEKKEVECLGLVEFLKSLQRKYSQYHILISLL